MALDAEFPIANSKIETPRSKRRALGLCLSGGPSASLLGFGSGESIFAGSTPAAPEEPSFVYVPPPQRVSNKGPFRRFVAVFWRRSGSGYDVPRMSKGKLRVRSTEVVQNKDPITINAAEGSINVSWEHVPPIHNVYDADCVGVRSEMDSVSLFFGKRALGEEKLRSRVEVRYGRDLFQDRFWPNCATFHSKLEAMNLERPSYPDILQLRADKEFSDWASFEYLSYSGTQASLDFYRLPVSGLAKYVTMKTSSGIVIEPILRILTSRTQLRYLLDLCKPIATDGPPLRG